MKTVKISQGMNMSVSDEDYEYFCQRKYFAIKSSNTYYATRHERHFPFKTKAIYAHREVAERMGLKVDKQHTPDHIDHNGLHNERENIRLSNKSESVAHRRLMKSSTTGLIGVKYDKKNFSYCADTSLQNHAFEIGSYPTAEEAGAARDYVAKRLHKEFAVLNFPDRDYETPNRLLDAKIGYFLRGEKYPIRQKKRSDNTSGFIDVSWDSARKKYHARLTVNGGRISLGYYDDKIEAARVRDCKEIEVHGDLAVLNFPRSDYE